MRIPSVTTRLTAFDRPHESIHTGPVAAIPPPAALFELSFACYYSHSLVCLREFSVVAQIITSQNAFVKPLFQLFSAEFLPDSPAFSQKCGRMIILPKSDNVRNMRDVSKVCQSYCSVLSF